MPGHACPDDSEIHAWLHDRAGERERGLSSHFEGCQQCQRSLSRIDEQAAAASDDWLTDLRRRPPTDPIESESECAGAARRVARLHRDSVEADGAAVQRSEPFTQLGPYRILEVLGQGGMGVVYKARHEKLDRVVAVKVLPIEKMRSGGVARFEREMKAVARLAHPNVVTAYDAAEQDGIHFLVLEYVDGVDLKALVASRGPLPIAEAVSYVVQAARGLLYAHEQGIVHRDVKPSNLMLDRAGNVKLLDLGLARLESETKPDDAPEPGSTTNDVVSDLTAPGAIMGTVDYMAPEQAVSSHVVDARADIYSLGCTLYFLLTGRAPYDGDTILQKVSAHLKHPIPELHQACPEAPSTLDHVFAKMVAKHPDERFGSMDEVIGQLEQSGAMRAVAARKGVFTFTGGSWPRAISRVVLVLLVVTLLLGVALFRNLKDKSDPAMAVDRMTPSDGEVELLPLVKLPDDTIRGIWTQSDSGLRIEHRHVTALLALPVAIDGSYLLRVEFTRGVGPEGPGVVFPVGAKHARIALDNFPNDGGISGIDLIHGLGLDVQHPDGSNTREFHVQDGKKYVVELRVALEGEEQVRIDARVDDRQLAIYRGPQSALSTHALLNLGRTGALGLTAYNSEIVFHSIKLEMITGKTQLLRLRE